MAVHLDWMTRDHLRSCAWSHASIGPGSVEGSYRISGWEVFDGSKIMLVQYVSSKKLKMFRRGENPARREIEKFPAQHLSEAES